MPIVSHSAMITREDIDAAIDTNIDVEEATTKPKADDTIVVDNRSGKRGTSESTGGSKNYRVVIDGRTLQLATASEVDYGEEEGEEEDDDDLKPGRGVLFCGSCCDLRRACILVNCVCIIKSINLSITDSIGMSFVHPTSTAATYFGDDDDDYYYLGSPAAATATTTASFTAETPRVGVRTAGLSPLYVLLIAKNCLSLVFALIGIVGAVRFEKRPVCSTAVWGCIDAALSAFCGRWLSAAVAGLVLYPQVALFLAFHHGAITPENYDTVKRCCCRRSSSSSGGGSAVREQQPRSDRCGSGVQPQPPQ